LCDVERVKETRRSSSLRRKFVSLFSDETTNDDEVRRSDLHMLVLVGTGVGKCATGACAPADAPDPIAAGAGAVTVFVLLRAFASGAAALTGVEAVSNGVNAFRAPAGKNAARTLVVMAAIAITLFVTVSWLAVHMHARPSNSVSVVSEIARAVFPSGSWTSFMYYAVQAFTFAILVLAANTSYQGFPRLGAVLARDRFFPRQFINLGDRLVYSNGVIVLAAIASFLIWIFHADVLSLIHAPVPLPQRARSAACSYRGHMPRRCAPSTTPRRSASPTRKRSSSPSTTRRPTACGASGSKGGCAFRWRSRRRRSATSAIHFCAMCVRSRPIPRPLRS
jgi:hypothetical protein